MSKRAAHIKIEELETDNAVVKNLEVSIGRIFDETWTEPVGPTPFPSVTDLREWDFRVLQRYKPFYLPFCDVCCLCTFGKCDLTGDKRGACGLNMAAQQSRIVLLACCIGAATHTAHARHLVEHLIEKYGRNSSLDVGGLNIDIEAIRVADQAHKERIHPVIVLDAIVRLTMKRQMSAGDAVVSSAINVLPDVDCVIRIAGNCEKK